MFATSRKSHAMSKADKRIKPNEMRPDVWGPHYWFFLQTVAYIYPETPNTVIKRKYYDFIQNIPLFIPNDEISKLFSVYLDKYPVTPYLVKRSSLLRWIHFIHNKINKKLNKPVISYWEAIENYQEQFYSNEIIHSNKIEWTREIIYIAVLLFMLLLAFVFHD